MEFFSEHPDLQARFDKIEAELERTVSKAQRKYALQRLQEVLKGNGNALPLADLATLCRIHRQTLWRILDGSNLPSGINAVSILQVCKIIDEIRDFWDHVIINWPKHKKSKEALGIFWPSIFHNCLNGDLKYTDRLNRLVRLHVHFWAKEKRP